jgi:hypothetical protein
MRGLCAALVIADLTWASLKTLHEHTIINHLQPNRRTKTKMNSIPVKKPLHPATRPTKTARDISARFGRRAGVRQQGSTTNSDARRVRICRLLIIDRCCHAPIMKANISVARG